MKDMLSNGDMLNKADDQAVSGNSGDFAAPTGIVLEKSNLDFKSPSALDDFFNLKVTSDVPDSITIKIKYPLTFDNLGRLDM